MASGESTEIIGQFERLFGAGTIAGLSDGPLLERFVARGDEIAFRALLARHGPMVLAVCRNLLANPADIDDAFQATFLVLVRKAGAIRQPERLGAWLYGVAHRVARRARANSARRCAQETPAGPLNAVAAPQAAVAADDSRVLHEEVVRLPQKYRLPIVLCYFEGHTHEETASRLRWPVGTVRGRLARARDMLHRRLVRRGVALSAAGLAALIDSQAAAGAVPAALLESTTHCIALLLPGRAALIAATSASVARLVQGTTKAMNLSRWKIVTAIAIAGCGLVAGAGVLAFQEDGKTPQKPAAPAAAASPKAEPSQPAISAGDRSALVAELEQSIELLEVQAEAKKAELEGEQAAYQFHKAMLEERKPLHDANAISRSLFLETEIAVKRQESRIKVKEAEYKEAMIRLAHARRRLQAIGQGKAASLETLEAANRADWEGRLRALEQKVDAMHLELEALKPRAK